MHEMHGTNLKTLPVIDLQWLANLIEFEGPLLSVFKARKNKYLYYWCDCNGESNRWMICRVSQTNLIRLINKQLSLDELIPDSLEDDFVYFEDVDGDGKATAVKLVNVTNVPTEYFPKEGSYLPYVVDVNDENYNIIIEKTPGDSNLQDLLKHFAQAYAFLYNIVKYQSKRLAAHPWKGGFSSLHFSRELLHSIAVSDYPEVQSMAFSSPGYIAYKSDNSISYVVSRCVKKYIEQLDLVNKLHSDMMNFIRQNGLNNDNIDPETQTSDEINISLKDFAKQLYDFFDLPHSQNYFDTKKTPFMLAKMMLFFLKRIKTLANLESDRIVRFTQESAR